MEQAKTPVLADKRLWVSVGTVISLLVSRYLGVALDPELLATVALVVVGYVTNSAMKEAKVAGQLAAAGVADSASAVAVLNAPAATATPAPK
jgi:hypothetical protein